MESIDLPFEHSDPYRSVHSDPYRSVQVSQSLRFVEMFQLFVKALHCRVWVHCRKISGKLWWWNSYFQTISKQDNWTSVCPQYVSLSGHIQHFLLIQLKPKHQGQNVQGWTDKRVCPFVSSPLDVSSI